MYFDHIRFHSTPPTSSPPFPTVTKQIPEAEACHLAVKLPKTQDVKVRTKQDILGQVLRRSEKQEF